VRILIKFILEKQLRDAAAAEVAQQNNLCSDDSDKGSKKRKVLSADDKVKQKYVKQLLTFI
jgi:hypothetical protein